MVVPDKAPDPTLFAALPDLLHALVSLLWLLLACFAFWRFYAPLKSAIDSRSLSVDIGGFKLSFPEATEGLKKQVTDLQSKVAQLEASLDSLRSKTPLGDLNFFGAITPPLKEPEVLYSQVVRPSQAIPMQIPVLAPALAASPQPPPPAAAAPADLALHLLWVDDNPKNNAYEIEAIQAAGGSVVTSVSTADALARLSDGHFQAIITDLGRLEKFAYRSHAGMQLIEAVRKRDRKIPIFVYTTNDQVGQQEVAARTAGANGITSSPVELFEMLRRVPRTA